MQALLGGAQALHHDGNGIKHERTGDDEDLQAEGGIDQFEALNPYGMDAQVGEGPISHGGNQQERDGCPAKAEPEEDEKKEREDDGQE